MMSHHRLTGLRPELETLLRRFGVGQAPSLGRQAVVCIVATTVNLAQIERAYGSTFATAVRHELRRRARALCREHSGTVAMSGKHLLFVFDVLPPRHGAHGGLDTQPVRLLDLVLTRLSERPVRSGTVAAFALIEASIARFEDQPFDIDSVNAKRFVSTSPGADSQEQFAADTLLAERLLGAMNDGRLDFDYERICDTKAVEGTLYREALLRETGDASCGRNRVGSEIRALERLGIVRCLDRWVVSTIVDRLKADPEARLGCNISTRSAVLDGWWALIITALALEPDVASRLTIEITETFRLTDFTAAREFVAALRSLNCRVALDDVGHDFGSLRKLITLGVDIVKLDRSLVADCRDDETAAARFTQLVEFAKVCAGSIVVEGIETERDAKAASASGATGLQGFLYSSSDN